LIRDQIFILVLVKATCRFL